jgi:hypothetical protein
MESLARMLGEFFRDVLRNEIIVQGGQKSMRPDQLKHETAKLPKRGEADLPDSPPKKPPALQGMGRGPGGKKPFENAG